MHAGNLNFGSVELEFSNCTFHDVSEFEVDSTDVGVRIRDCT